MGKRTDKNRYGHRPFPDFLCIGAQKSGTTWLTRNLRRHPEVFVCREKEPHFFDQHLDRGLNWYSSLFEGGEGMVKGEITPGYAIMPVRKIARVKRLMPEGRFIMLCRNPIDRAWSMARMNLVKRQRRPYEEVPEEEFFAHFASARSRRRGDYNTTIKNWLSLFKKEQLLVRFFEDLEERPRQLLEEVFDHIGVSRNVNWRRFPYKKVINRGLEFEMPAKYREFLEELYTPEIEVLVQTLGKPAERWLERGGENTKGGEESGGEEEPGEGKTLADGKNLAERRTPAEHVRRRRPGRPG